MIAEAIPLFPELLGIMSSLFASMFTYILPSIFYFVKFQQGKWNRDYKNIALSLLNGGILVSEGSMIWHDPGDFH